MKFLGHVIAFKRKTSEEAADDDVILEITELQASGLVELLFNDRDEHVYVRFKLQDFMSALAQFAITRMNF